MSCRLRVLSIIGTRPDAIKMFPVIRALGARPNRFESIVCSTGQQRDLVEQVFSDLDYRPDIDLDLMVKAQSMSDAVSRIVASIAEVIDRVCPDVAVVQGDTITAAGAALSAHYARVPVAHVEAGLRTYDNRVPFPEEGNRRLISALASLHFAPSATARDNLLGEGVPPANVHLTGNPGIDTLCWGLARLPANDVGEHCVLITAHRRENIDQIPALIKAVADTALRHPAVRFVWPAHPNPGVQLHLGSAPLPSNVAVPPPLPYLQFLRLLRAARFVATDSGGLQEEAAFIGKPLIVLKEKTSRIELVDRGLARLVPYDRTAIVTAFERLLGDGEPSAPTPTDVYGDGHAAIRIVDVLDRASRDLCQNVDHPSR